MTYRPLPSPTRKRVTVRRGSSDIGLAIILFAAFVIAIILRQVAA